MELRTSFLESVTGKQTEMNWTFEIVTKGMQGRRSKFFSRRQSDSSLIVGRIIDPRPGLRALLIDPFVSCVTH
jgi:hypothetical protein